MVQRRKFSAEFKWEAAELTHRPQAPVSRVAQELGVNANVLSRWRSELSRVTKEMDFLRDVAAFFAEESS